MAIAEPKIHRVAVVDDKVADANYMSEFVRDAGYEPIVLAPPFGDLADLHGRMRDEAVDAVVCDHRLRGRAHFTGAEAVADLVKRHVPAVLVTQYADTDAAVPIRYWRDRIPVLLSRDQADAESIREALAACAREIRGEYLPGRRPWRALLQVDGTSMDSGELAVEVRVLPWNPLEVVRFPAALVPPELQDRLVEGGYLFAQVNLGAERQEDLYFRDFEAAPDPDQDDGLG